MKLFVVCAALGLDTLSGLMESKFDHYQGQSVSDRFRRLVQNGGKNR